MNEEEQEEFYEKVNDFGRPRKQENDKTFNTSDSRTFELNETNSELYKEIKERASEAKKSLNEQGLEIGEETDIVIYSTNPNIKTTSFIMTIDKETGKFKYYEDDSDD